jgi:hypothetical protein
MLYELAEKVVGRRKRLPHWMCMPQKLFVAQALSPASVLFPCKVVLVGAEAFLDFAILGQREHSCEYEGLRQSLWIFDGVLDFQTGLRRTAIALHYVHFIAVRFAGVVQPGSVIEADGVDYQSVAFPFADGIAGPTVGLDVQVVLASV